MPRSTHHHFHHGPCGPHVTGGHFNFWFYFRLAVDWWICLEFNSRPQILVMVSFVATKSISTTLQRKKDESLLILAAVPVSYRV
mmetsp:Transcript_1925/g.4071  ORF Transcript_1925/g.4071 Transcript_1925/m.4071 type:complete len:84 (-) Transcript_1925:1018-1269(-)